MACFVPFNNKNLDTSFFIFRPTVVLVDDFVDELKKFSSCAQSLGCVRSSIFRSIHGNMIIWYGTWLKMSSKNKDLLTATLLSMLSNLSSMAIITEHSFFDAYAGESIDGSSAAKFSTGDIISMNVAATTSSDLYDLSYGILAIFKSRFQNIEGITASVCLRCEIMPRVVWLNVWKSLQLCYSWILNKESRKSMLLYLDRFSVNLKYDIFRVIHVSGDHNGLNFQSSSANQLLENGKESTGTGSAELRYAANEPCIAVFSNYISCFVNSVYKFYNIFVNYLRELIFLEYD
ncbi:Serine incorporator 4 [Quillaja saponaria]|uniref:Serine incorporator 4 n=1 Tax=Quillaja saponaria TaxID=32244 RepID=A0AAD7M5B8_QUISA|nr:Serine incorporator 4 [Quillaja saponaria]